MTNAQVNLCCLLAAHSIVFSVILSAMVRSNTVNVTIRSSNPLLSVLGNEQVGFIGLDIMVCRS